MFSKNKKFKRDEVRRVCEICIPAQPNSFNFLIRVEMIIILNKWDEIGMKAIRPKLVLLSFLNIVNLFDKYLF